MTAPRGRNRIDTSGRRETIVVRAMESMEVRVNDDHGVVGDTPDEDGKDFPNPIDKVHTETKESVGFVGIGRDTEKNQTSILTVVPEIIFGAVTEIILVSNLECPLNVLVGG